MADLSSLLPVSAGSPTATTPPADLVTAYTGDRKPWETRENIDHIARGHHY